MQLISRAGNLNRTYVQLAAVATAFPSYSFCAGITKPVFIVKRVFLVFFFACLFFRCSIKFHFILRPYYRTGIHCENMCACPLVHVKSNPQFSTKHFLGSEANRASRDFCGAGIGMFWFPTILDTSGPESFHRARIGKIENCILLTDQDKWRK